MFRHSIRLMQDFRGLVLVAGICSCLISAPAAGDVIQWNLVDIAFDDGGVATGWFEYDSDFDLFGDWSIQLSEGPDYTAAAIDSSNSSARFVTIFATTIDVILFDLDPAFGTHPVHGEARQLRFEHLSALTNAGGIVELGPQHSSECYNCSSPRSIVEGYLSTSDPAIPEPSAALVFGLGSLVMGSAVCRKKQ